MTELKIRTTVREALIDITEDVREAVCAMGMRDGADYVYFMASVDKEFESLLKK